MSRLSYEQIVAAYLAVAVLTAVVVLLGVCAFRQRAAERGAPDALRRGDGAATRPLSPRVVRSQLSTERNQPRASGSQVGARTSRLRSAD